MKRINPNTVVWTNGKIEDVILNDRGYFRCKSK